MPQYGVSTANPLATKIGLDILDKGGNAVDAAIAVSFALGVLEPYASGLGGGGAMLIRSSSTSIPIIIDYREVAPYTVEINEEKIGIPGFVKGMEYIHNKFGTIKLVDLIKPSVKLAHNGFRIGNTFAQQLWKVKHLNKEKVPHFYPNKEPLVEGSFLIQNHLAEVLFEIGNKGADEFYKGSTAKRLSTLARIPLKDIKRYKVLERAPVKGTFEDYCVYSAPSPLGGGLIVQFLNMFEILYKDDLSKLGITDLIEIVSELINICNIKGYDFFGDPDFINLNEDYLTSKTYCRNMAVNFLDKFRGRIDYEKSIQDNNNTTHFVVMDKNGQMVSVTNSISYIFGSGIYCDGFFLNNQLKNFSDQNESPNYQKNGKRPYSLIAPTIITHSEKTIGIGSSGGQRISTVLCYILLEILKGTKTISDILNLPRFFYNQQTMFIEKGHSQDTIKKLINKGYQVEFHDDNFYFGAVQCLIYDKREKTLHGSADRRRNGLCVIKD